MNDQKQLNVEINAVGNGYMVRPANDHSCMQPRDKTVVFETFDNLVAYLRSVLPVFLPPPETGSGEQRMTTTKRR